jgi:hypothetical protein
VHAGAIGYVSVGMCNRELAVTQEFDLGEGERKGGPAAELGAREAEVNWVREKVLTGTVTGCSGCMGGPRWRAASNTPVGSVHNLERAAEGFAGIKPSGTFELTYNDNLPPRHGGEWRG